MFPDVIVGMYPRTNRSMVNRTKRKTEGPDRRDRHILVVDDESSIRKLAKRILTAKGYSVTTCRSGVEATEVYSKLHDEIDLVTLDMVMPDMNGLETLRRLKQIDPTVRVILCSAFIPDFDGHTVATEGFVGLIAKPFNIANFLAMVDLHMK